MNAAPASGLPGVRVALRTRSAWQALDLGTLLLRQHALMLYGSWLLVTLPVVTLISVLPGGTFTWGVVVVFWLKPVFERVTVLCLARELFGEPVTLRRLLQLFARSLTRQTVATLVWRRCSFTRAIDQPVILLEAAQGAVRRARLNVLHRTVSANAFWTMAVLLLLELMFVSGVMTTLMSMQPRPLDDLSVFVETWPIALPTAWFIAIWMVGPLHAAAGFALYINRRCELEAWDIEVGFRRLADRLKRGATPLAMLLCCVLLTVGVPADRASAAPPAQTPLPALPAALQKQQTQAPRSQPAARGAAAEQARRDIAEVLADETFHVRGQRTYPAFLDEREPASDDPDPGTWSSGFFSVLAEWAWWMFWAAVVLLSLWIASQYPRWARALKDRAGSGTSGRRTALVVAGVELHATTAQDDSVSAATALWAAGAERQALAMLLRMSLTQLVAQGVQLRSGDTEADCLRATEVNQSASASAFLRRLIDCWLPLAYAHRRPDDAAVVQLLADFANGHLAARDDAVPAAAQAGP